MVDPNNVGATDIDPADPTTWTSGTLGYIGTTADGSIQVNGGSELLSSDGVLGTDPGSTGKATIAGAGSQWNSTAGLYVGLSGGGTLSVEEGGRVSSANGHLGYLSDSTGEATITGAGSRWNHTNTLYVGGYGSGTLSVEAGALVSSSYAVIGLESGSTGTATITGSGSRWNISAWLAVGAYGSGTLSITDDGLVSVAGGLIIDYDADGDDFVNMASGGMLALPGATDGSLTEFLELAEYADAIRYYDTSLPGWAPITAATEGVDYSLQYETSGDLEGYTKLTVFTPIPEPRAWMLLVMFVLAMLCHYRMVRSQAA